MTGTVQGEAVHRKPRRPLRSVLVVLGVAVLVSALIAGGLALWLNSSLGNVQRVEVTLPETSRPTASDDGSLNILLLGADAGTARNGAGSSILRDAASGNWPTGKYRSDATMLLHIDADREKVYVFSIPRDSYVPIFDGTGTERGPMKVNAALSLHGPSGAIATVEGFTGLRIDHLAMVDWDGFEALTDSIGGVEIAVGDGAPRTFDGAEALDYVRERKQLPNGDFDRVKRQQNYLRAVVKKVLQRGIVQNPVSLKRTLDAVTTNLAVDEGWSSGDMRSLALSMRDLRPADMVFATIPTSGTANDPVAGSIVVVDEEACAELFEAIAKGQVQPWLDENRQYRLGGFVH